MPAWERRKRAPYPNPPNFQECPYNYRKALPLRHPIPNRAKSKWSINMHTFRMDVPLEMDSQSCQQPWLGQGLTAS